MSTSGTTQEQAIGSRRWRTLVIASIGLILCFFRPLLNLTLFAFSSELYSYIILIPLIALYLVCLERERVPLASEPARKLAYLFFVAGLIVLAVYWTAVARGWRFEREDSLALTTLSYVLLFWGICCWFLGKRTLRPIMFPLGFLILMVPLPVFLRTWIETSLQHSSAMAALVMFKLTGTPVFYSDLSFQLPDITIKVAPECSGIHSTIALFITSLLAAYFFLRSSWKRSAVVLAIVPLAILRNGFRVFTIGELCVHVGPEMIDSNIHHKGGPIFFVLSLVPLLIILFYQIKSERLENEPKPISS